MIVADLSMSSLRERLASGRLHLRTGPVSTRIRSPLPDVATGIALHYRRHTLLSEDAFADFHIGIDVPGGLRRWLRPQVVFRFDDEAPFAPLPRDQGFPMLEWGMNWCISAHCHQFLIVHAAVLARGDRALLMPAPSGSGKSTLCAGLVYRGGWRLMSDELALMDMRDGRLSALARPVSLKNQSIDVIARFAPEVRFGQVVHETQKGTVTHLQPPDDAVEGVDRTARPRWVVLPRYEAGARTRLSPLSRAQAFMRLIDSSFNYPVHGRAGFELLADVVSGCDCHEFVYSDLHEAVERLGALDVGDD